MDNSIGIYFHIPFCKQKCNYCDFNSYSGREHLAGPYFDALFSEMRLRAGEIGNRPVKTIFIGGGTPSLVNPNYINDLLELCSILFQIVPGAEISMESNPGTLSVESLKAYRAAGVNRLSIGLQAWQDRLLKEMGRIHDSRQFAENFKAAVQAGFENINIDLIFGLPGQTFDEWAETLEAVMVLGAGTVPESGASSSTDVLHGRNLKQGSNLTHLSCYSLKIEEGTVFGDRYDAGTLKPADDELDRRMYRFAVEYLAEKGFHQYEISNFARPGYECRHNLVYWKAREYAGFGAGAHSYLDGMRFGNVTGIEQYITAIKHKSRSSEGFVESALHEDVQHIDRQDAMSEFMILGLRLNEGISSVEFEERFGESLQVVYGEKLARLVKQGLLEQEPASLRLEKEPTNQKQLLMKEERFKLTQSGLDLANRVFVEFI